MSKIEALEQAVADLDTSDLDDPMAAVERIHNVAWRLLDIADELSQAHLEHVIAPALAMNGLDGWAGLLVSGPGDADEIH